MGHPYILNVLMIFLSVEDVCIITLRLSEYVLRDELLGLNWKIPKFSRGFLIYVAHTYWYLNPCLDRVHLIIYGLISIR